MLPPRWNRDGGILHATVVAGLILLRQRPGTAKGIIFVTMDDETAERYAVILNGLWTAGTPIPTNDIWIAASAMQYGLTVVTTDAHFLKIPQILVSHSSPAT